AQISSAGSLKRGRHSGKTWWTTQMETLGTRTPCALLENSRGSSPHPGNAGRVVTRPARQSSPGDRCTAVGSPRKSARRLSGSASRAELGEGGKEDGPEPDIEPGLAQHPGEVLAELAVVEADDPGAAPGQGQRPGEIVKDLG